MTFAWSSSLGELDEAAAREPVLTLPDVAQPTPVDLALEASVPGCGSPERTTASFALLPAAAVVPSVAPHPACATAAMRFTAAPPGGAGPFAYLWDFGDGGVSTDPAPTHAYAAGGVYAATLTVSDLGTGCAASATFDVIVWQPCCAASLAAVAGVRALRGAADMDVTLSWDLLSGATGGYDTWVVGDKTLLPLAREPGGAGIRKLCGPAPALGCVHAGGLDPAAGAFLLYQVRGVCGGLEGP
jgi:hypothetical protein